MKPYRKVHQWWSSALALLLITGFAPTCNYRYEGVGHGSRGWCGECVKGFGLYADAFAPRSGGSGLTVPRTREFRSNFGTLNDLRQRTRHAQPKRKYSDHGHACRRDVRMLHSLLQIQRLGDNARLRKAFSAHTTPIFPHPGSTVA